MMRGGATHVDGGDGVAVVLCVLEESVDIVTDDDLSALVGVVADGAGANVHPPCG
jgi:hypothetical protein